MKGIRTLVAASIILFSSSIAQAGDTVKAPWITKRQIAQQKRIYQGIKTGQLTLREFFKLEKEQARISRQRQRYASDGVLTKRERLKLHHHLNRASRHIFREKHDRQRR